MVSFTRTLQKHITKTGAHYVLSIPREIAQALDLLPCDTDRSDNIKKEFWREGLSILLTRSWRPWRCSDLCLMIFVSRLQHPGLQYTQKL